MGNTLAIDRLEGHIDQICDMLINGDTYRQIATFYGVSLGAFHSYINKDEHSARVKTALTMSADDYDDKAERVLKEAKSNLPEIMRAKELAAHYRRKASVRNRGVYGDKVDTNINIDIKRPMTPEQFQKFLEIQERKAIGQQTIDTSYEDVTETQENDETTEHEEDPGSE